MLRDATSSTGSVKFPITGRPERTVVRVSEARPDWGCGGASDITCSLWLNRGPRQRRRRRIAVCSEVRPLGAHGGRQRLLVGIEATGEWRVRLIEDVLNLL
jgi:hypothetical protein